MLRNFFQKKKMQIHFKFQIVKKFIRFYGDLKTVIIKLYYLIIILNNHIGKIYTRKWKIEPFRICLKLFEASLALAENIGGI